MEDVERVRRFGACPVMSLHNPPSLCLVGDKVSPCHALLYYVDDDGVRCQLRQQSNHPHLRCPPFLTLLVFALLTLLLSCALARSLAATPSNPVAYYSPVRRRPQIALFSLSSWPSPLPRLLFLVFPRLPPIPSSLSCSPFQITDSLLPFAASIQREQSTRVFLRENRLSRPFRRNHGPKPRGCRR